MWDESWLLNEPFFCLQGRNGRPKPPCLSSSEVRRVLSREKQITRSLREKICLASAAGGHGNLPLIKCWKCNFVCLGWTFLNVITRMSSGLVSEGYLLLFQVKIVQLKVYEVSQFWYISVQRARIQVCAFSVETFLNICHGFAPIESLCSRCTKVYWVYRHPSVYKAFVQTNTAAAGTNL